MSENLKKARRAQAIALYGAIGFVAVTAIATFVLTGSFIWPAIALSLIPAAFHYFGCQMFVRYYKALAEHNGETS
ncbi:hypothetical protein [Robiginitomaculum antarcticum]|uniref:hypothetical protein n=1 Tax=Robiginitomaculum antarcticum TaxID=437507 RepID=UPI000361E742|nr:hypothetical protein [Robiginitomaculum antarcticum]